MYEFYERLFTDFFPVLHCCEKPIISRLSFQSLNDEPSKSKEPLSGTVSSTHFESYDDLPQLESPWDIQEFISDNQNSPFMMAFPNDLFYSQLFETHVKFLYHKVCDIIRKLPQDWSDAFITMNAFPFSNVHISSV